MPIPLFLEILFEAEEKNAEGFAKECAGATHYRLKNDPAGNGKLIVSKQNSKRELVIRPTSEAIIWILIKAGDPVLLWPADTGKTSGPNGLDGKCVPAYSFTAEFLWQEGHTACKQKAHWGKSADFAWALYGCSCYVSSGKPPTNVLLVPRDTYCIEARWWMANVAGRNFCIFWTEFAKAFDVQFLNKENAVMEYVAGHQLGSFNKTYRCTHHGNNKGMTKVW